MAETIGLGLLPEEAARELGEEVGVTLIILLLIIGGYTDATFDYWGLE